MTTTLAESRKAAFLAALTDAQILDALRHLAELPKLDEHERMTSAWLSDEVERRHPELDAAMQRHFEDVDARLVAGEDVPDERYAATLIRHAAACGIA
ncbi:MAG TPA: hypothetical protein VFL65_00930 [Jatrophihabitans sp.]|nr:hypothetical protein [Jatrophihabitans sp.]